MNYEQMSDQEINQQVTAIEFGCEQWAISEDGTILYHCGIEGAGYYSQPVIDYCNSPADAWPIITGHNISLAWNETVLYMYTAQGGLSDGIAHQYQYAHTNPIRAAMIVYLMMNEG